MPTVTTVTVKSTGGDYSSLNAAEAGEQADLVSADVQLDIECYAFDDTTAVTFTGWTTDATRYIRVYAATGEGHEGVWSTSKYRLRSSSGFGNVLGISEDFVRLEGLQLYTNGSYSTVLRGTGVGSGGVIYVTNCIFKGDLGTASLGMVYPDGVGSTWHFRNCLIFGGSHEGVDGGTSGGGTFNFDNCTVVANTTYGFVRTGGTFNLRNCYSGGNGTDDYNADGSQSRTTCMHSSATSFTGSTGSIAYDTTNFTNVTSGSEDLHLPSGSDLIGQGVNLSEYFTTDIDGETRPAAEILYADTVELSTNYTTANLTDIDDDPLSPDATFWTWDGAGPTSCRVGFPTPASSPAVGANYQEFWVQIRKNAVLGNDPGYAFHLHEGATAIRTFVTDTLTDALSPLLLLGRWNANELATADGSAVSMRLNQNSGGTGGSARGVEVGAVKWVSGAGLWDVGADQLVAAGNDQISGTCAITCTPTADLNGTGELSGTCAIQTGVGTADLEGTGELAGSAAVVFGESANLTLVPQFAVPVADLSVDGWRWDDGVSDGGTDLYLVLDEGFETFSDTDFIYNTVTNPSNAIYNFDLTDLSTPYNDLNHVIRFRYKLFSDEAATFDLDLTIELLEGATVRFTEVLNFTSAGAGHGPWTTVELTLTESEASNIVDYSNLNARITANKVSGSSFQSFEVSVFELEVPGSYINQITGTSNPAFTVTGNLTNAAGNSQISGSCDLTFTESADLNGSGELAGSSSPVFTPTADLNAVGELIGSSNPVFSLSAELLATGELSGSVNLTFGESADLNGSGELGGNTTPTFTNAATLEATGELSGSSTSTFSLSGNLTNAVEGSIVGQSDLAFTLQADLNGSGELSGSANLTTTVTADLNGTGELSGSSALQFTASGSASVPSSSISGSSNLSFSNAGELTGVARLAGLVALSMDSSAALTARASMSGTSVVVFSGSLSTEKPYLDTYIDLTDRLLTVIELSDQLKTAILLSDISKTNIDLSS